MQFVWILYILLALLFSKSILINYMGIIWIVIAVNLYALGSICGRGLKTNYSNRKPKLLYIINYTKSKRLLIVSLSLLMIILILSLISSGISFRTFFNIDTLFNINANATQERYLGNHSITLFERINLQIKTILTYFTPFLGGLFLVIAKGKKDIILCYLVFLPTIFGLLLSNSKLGLITSVFLFICGFIMMNLMLYGKLPKLEVKRIIYSILLIMLFFAFLFFAMILRIGRYDSYIIEILKYKFINYAFGSLFAFDHWLSNLETIDLYLGARTFNGISNLLGILVRKQGVYTDFFVDGFWRTNVYTAFRGIIDDFGRIGGLIFMYVGGFIAGVAYGKVKNNRSNILWYVVLSANYFFIFYSFMISPWSYTSLILVFILMAIVLNVVKEKKLPPINVLNEKKYEKKK